MRMLPKLVRRANVGRLHAFLEGHKSRERRVALDGASLEFSDFVFKPSGDTVVWIGLIGLRKLYVDVIVRRYEAFTGA